MSDIVERLRYFGSQMCHEAADEITSLRSERDQLRQYLDAAQRRGEELRAQVAALEGDAGRWAPVQDYEGYYEVSNFGQVRSLDRIDSDGNRRIGKMLHPSPTTKGYLRVSLWRENRSGERYVHRMVATAFHANEHNKPEVNHKDGDTKNNHATNLEWVDQSENGRHRARVLKTGVLRPIVGVSTKDSAVIKFGSFQLAKDAGFTPSLIDKCIKGQRTHHKGFAWSYADAAIDAALAARKGLD